MNKQEIQRKKWAKEVQARRRSINWSQERLARESGFSVSFIQKIETAQKGTQDTIDRLLELLRTADQIPA